ncbi:MAG: Flp pilus assembly protein CpaB [Acidimicrobiales bacterium]
MSSRRTLILLGAIGVGVIAALLLFQYVRGIEDRANQNAKRVDVFAAKGEIKRGVPGEQATQNGDIAKAQIPQEFRPNTAINTTDEIAKKVALFDIAPGTVIVQGMFVDPATTQITFRSRIKNPEHVAMSIQVDQVRGVAGFLVGGDEVNMMIFEDLSAENAAAGGGGTQGGTDANRQAAALKSRARMLYQKVQIIAVGQQAALEPGEQPASSTSGSSSSSASNTGLITLVVPPEASLWIASAQQGGGQIYLALDAEDYKAKEVKQVPQNVTLLPGEDPAILTPYGPNGNTDK